MKVYSKTLTIMFAIITSVALNAADKTGLKPESPQTAPVSREAITAAAAASAIGRSKSTSPHTVHEETSIKPPKASRPIQMNLKSKAKLPWYKQQMTPEVEGPTAVRPLDIKGFTSSTKTTFKADAPVRTTVGFTIPTKQ